MSVPSVYTQIILCHFISEIQGFILWTQQMKWNRSGSLVGVTSLSSSVCLQSSDILLQLNLKLLGQFLCPRKCWAHAWVWWTGARWVKQYWNKNTVVLMIRVQGVSLCWCWWTSQELPVITWQTQLDKQIRSCKFHDKLWKYFFWSMINSWLTVNFEKIWISKAWSTGPYYNDIQ